MTGSSGWCSKSRRLALYIRADFRCVYCAKCLKDAKAYQLTLDHLEDLVDGGGHKGANHASTNLVLACTTCNSTRKNMLYTEFAARFPGALARIEAQRSAPVNIDLAKSLINAAK